MPHPGPRWLGATASAYRPPADAVLVSAQLSQEALSYVLHAHQGEHTCMAGA